MGASNDETVDPDTGEIVHEGEIVMRAGDSPLIADSALVEAIEAMTGDLTVDPGEVAEQITRRILEATTADEVLAPQGVEKSEDWVGRPIEIHGGRWMRSDYDESAGVYAVIAFTDPESGARLMMSCGARNVMAQLIRLDQLGALPIKVKIVRSPRPSARGFYPLWLEPA